MQHLSRKNSYRLSGHDYASVGYYFVTVLVKHRAQVLSKIVGERVKLLAEGHVVRRYWKMTLRKNPNIRSHAFVIMPDHIHILIEINSPFLKKHQSISTVVSCLKRYSCNRIRKEVNPGYEWHRSFHDSIPKTRQHVKNIKKYIKQNPKKWSDMHHR